MSAQKTLLTAEDLLTLAHGDWRYELVKGELIKMPPTGFEHGKVTTILTVLLAQHVRQHHLGVVLAAETGFVLARDPDVVRAADVSFVSSGRLPISADQRRFFEGAPDLAAEVVSPHDTALELQQKIEDYLRAGTLLVWVLYPTTRTVVVYRPSGAIELLSEDDTLSGGDVVPGFACPVQEIFAG